MTFTQGWQTVGIGNEKECVVKSHSFLLTFSIRIYVFEPQYLQNYQHAGREHWLTSYINNQTHNQLELKCFCKSPILSLPLNTYPLASLVSHRIKPRKNCPHVPIILLHSSLTSFYFRYPLTVYDYNYKKIFFITSTLFTSFINKLIK